MLLTTEISPAQCFNMFPMKHCLKSLLFFNHVTIKVSTTVQYSVILNNCLISEVVVDFVFSFK